MVAGRLSPQLLLLSVACVAFVAASVVAAMRCVVVVSISAVAVGLDLRLVVVPTLTANPRQPKRIHW